MTGKPSIFIFDIDGTLASKDGPYLPMGEMAPKKGIVKIALAAQKPEMGRMAIVTARPESARGVTESWVEEHGLKPEFLLMRKTGDDRPDYDVRVDQVKELIGKMGKNATLYDDKASNCKEVEKRLGIHCVHIK